MGLQQPQSSLSPDTANSAFKVVSPRSSKGNTEGKKRNPDFLTCCNFPKKLQGTKKPFDEFHAKYVELLLQKKEADIKKFLILYP